jgi:hypothetical protein
MGYCAGISADSIGSLSLWERVRERELSGIVDKPVRLRQVGTFD